MYDLEEAITERHSSRLFLRDKPVPQELIDEALELAVRAPSNSNIQPWQVVFASGSARDRLVEAQLAEAEAIDSGIVGNDRQAFDTALLDGGDEKFGNTAEAEAACHDRHAVEQHAFEGAVGIVPDFEHLCTTWEGER